MLTADQKKRRFNALCSRTVVVGWAGVALACASAVLCLNALSLLFDAARRDGPNALPAVHIPAAVRDATGTGLLLWVAAVIVILAIYGLSIGVFGRRTIPKLLLILAIVALLDLVLNSPTRQAMLVIPSELERHIDAGRFGEAEQILSRIPAPAMAIQYVKCQIALRANDDGALRLAGKPLIEAADAYVYGAGLNEDIASQPVADFNASVIHAIDARINGRAVSGISAEYEQRQEASLAAGKSTVVKGIAALTLAVISALVMRVWFGMRRRIGMLKTAIA